MTGNDSPFPQDGDASAYMSTQLDAMQAAIVRQDGQAVLDKLAHIAAETSAELANEMLAALVKHGIDVLCEAVKAGDPTAITHARRLLLS
jgi:hypothetical protein